MHLFINLKYIYVIYYLIEFENNLLISHSDIHYDKCFRMRKLNIYIYILSIIAYSIKY